MLILIKLTLIIIILTLIILTLIIIILTLIILTLITNQKPSVRFMNRKYSSLTTSSWKL